MVGFYGETGHLYVSDLESFSPWQVHFTFDYDFVLLFYVILVSELVILKND